MKYSTVLFDLDGTLTDPVQGICGSVRYALQKAGRPVGPIESYHKYIGPPLLRSFEVYANATPEEAQELLGYYRERFSTVGLFENEVYPGIPELLRDLKASGVRIAVATGKPTVFSEQILEHFGLRQYIDVVSGTRCTKWAFPVAPAASWSATGHTTPSAQKWRGSISSACFTATAAAKSWKPKEPTPSQTALQRCEASCFHKIIQHPACPTASTVRQAGCVFIGVCFFILWSLPRLETS